MSLRIALVTVLLLTAGCLGGSADPASSPTASPTEKSPDQSDTPIPSPTTTLTEQCIAVEHNVVNPTRDSVTPSELPEGPPELTESAVVEYVIAYEEAYGRNKVLRSDTKRATHSVLDSTVSAVDGGFVVEVRAVGTWTEQGITDGNNTATAVVADGAPANTSYLVTDDRLLRAEGDYDGSTPPREGKTMECW